MACSRTDFAEKPRYTFTIPPQDRTYGGYGLELTPIGWEAPLTNPEPLSQLPTSLATTAETSAPSSIGPSASLAMDNTRRKLPVPHEEEVP